MSVHIQLNNQDEFDAVSDALQAYCCNNNIPATQRKQCANVLQRMESDPIMHEDDNDTIIYDYDPNVRR